MNRKLMVCRHVVHQALSVVKMPCIKTWSRLLYFALIGLSMSAMGLGLPSRYTRLEYVVADGRQWVHSGYTPACDDRIEAKIRFARVDTNQGIWCSRGTQYTLRNVGMIVSGKFRFSRNNVDTTTTAAVADTDYIVSADFNTLEVQVNGSKVGTMTSGSFEPAGPMSLFATHVSGSGLSDNTVMDNRFYGRFYYFKVYNSTGQLVREYLPAADGARCGLYEVVEGKWYESMTDWGFAAGPTVATTAVRSVHFVSADRAGDELNLQFVIDNPGYPQHAFLVTGASDAGVTTNGWEQVTALADVAADETTRTISVSTNCAFARLFIQPVIPDAKPLEYLRSNGTEEEYINTGFQPDNNTCTEIRFKVNSDAFSIAAPFGSRNANNSQYFVALDGKDKGNRWWSRYGSGSEPTYNTTTTLLGEHLLVFDNNRIEVDGTTTIKQGATFAKGYDMYVFAVNNNNAVKTPLAMDLYSLTLWDTNNLARVFVPCVKSDGTPALYDALNGGFADNSGTTLLTLGEELWRSTETIAIDESIPLTATWSGAGDRANVSDPGNWICRNLFGEVLEGTVPTNQTVVSIAGDTSFNLAQGSSIACRELVFDACRLVADCDWRGVDPALLPERVDLNGHRLQLNVIGALQQVIDSTPAETFEYITASKAQWINSKYAPKSTDRIEAKVSFASASVNQGVWCSRGTPQSRQNLGMLVSGKIRFGRKDTTVDTLAAAANTDYVLSLDGKTGEAKVNDQTQTTFTNGDYEPDGPMSILATHTSGTNLTFNTTMGNMFGGRLYYLRVWNGDGELVREYLPARRAQDGAIGLFETQTHAFCRNEKTTALSAGETLTENAPGELHLHDFSMVTGDSAEYSGNTKRLVHVYGTYQPESTTFPNLIMESGSRLDLSGEEGVWSTSSATGDTILDFATGATVDVCIGSRALAGGDQVLSWTTAPTNVSLRLERAAGYYSGILAIKADGAFVPRGMTILIR